MPVIATFNYTRLRYYLVGAKYWASDKADLDQGNTRT